MFGFFIEVEMKKTKYRIRQNGHGTQWPEHRAFFFWFPVPIPYYDKYMGREDANEYHGWLTGCDSQLKGFAGAYPNFNEYFDNEYYPEQEKLVNDAKIYLHHYNIRKNTIEYLD